MTILHHKLLTIEGMGFGHWMNASIIHDNFCKLSHKKRHLKSYHADMKYHVTINIIFISVVSGYKSSGYNICTYLLYFQERMVPKWWRLGPRPN